jgi:hypothetical protein
MLRQGREHEVFSPILMQSETIVPLGGLGLVYSWLILIVDLYTASKIQGYV